MRYGSNTYFLNYKSWLRIRSILLCLLVLVMLCSSTVLVVAEAIPGSIDLSWNTSSSVETREQIKSRLLRQIRYNGWDPYSADMTLDEYYALMELFNEGSLPLTSGFQKIMRAFGLDQPSSTAEGAGLFLPREKFFLVGLPSSFAAEEETDTTSPLVYDRDFNYEPYDPSTGRLYTVNEDGEYVLGSNKYTLNEEDGRLYQTTITGIVQYDYAFRLNGDYEKFYIRRDNNKLYEVHTNELYDFKGSNLFTSLATGKVYIVDPQYGLFEYVENAEGNAGDPFDETSGDYYYINGQLYQFKNKALYDPLGGIHPYVKAPAYRYPSGYGYENSGYLRPPKDWDGIEVRDKWQAVIVSDGINQGNYQISSDVDQSFFTDVQFEGYYVKQITIGGANVNVLGIIKVPETGNYVYYYLSAEGQNTQVSTTTLSDEDKFLIEYTPSEYKVEYEVKIDDSKGGASVADILQNNDNVADYVPQGVVFYGSNSATESSWVDSIFGTTSQRPAQTTDGAYAFNVTVPYGYEMQIIIGVDRIIDGTFWIRDTDGTVIELPNSPKTFHADIDHTSSRAQIEDTWLAAYGSTLAEYDLVPLAMKNGSFNLDEFTKNYLIRTPNNSGDNRNYSQPISFTWKTSTYADDAELHNAEIHNKVLTIIAERINDVVMHNSSRVDAQSGYPLGRYPVYNDRGDGGKAMSSKDGPAVRTMNDTFYNHLVKANRKITAILKYIGEPTFEIAHEVLAMNNANGRGTAATEGLAEDFDKLIADFEFHREGQYNNQNAEGDLFKHDNALFNLVEQDGGNNWNWNKSTFYNDNANVDVSKPMWLDEKTGTYSYAFMFQTNEASRRFFMDTLEINGIAIQLPFLPLYNTNEFLNNSLSNELADELNGFPWYTETRLQDGAIVTVQYLALFGNSTSNVQRIYRIAIEGARSNVVINAMNLMDYGNGASEFSVYNLVGVYDGEQSQDSESVQYYNGSAWETVQESAMRVNDGNYPASDVYGATFRFKVAEGYANPYYYWNNKNGVIEDPNNRGKYFASVPVAPNENGLLKPVTDAANPVISLNDATAPNYNGDGALVDGKLSSQYVYHNEDDDYYYIRIPAHGNDKIAYITIVCRTVIYAVRYLPFAGSGDEAWNGFVIEESSGKIIGGLTKELIASLGSDKDFKLVANSMPLFTTHITSQCLMWEMAQKDGEVPEEIEAILEQFDDNGGNFYDLIYNNMAGIASNANGTIKPRDETNSFAFVSWVMVDENFEPIYIDEDFNTINFSSGAIDFKVYKDYAVHNRAFNSEYADVFVIRLMPVWRVVSNPYYYQVVLNWIDATGTLHAENYTGWDEVMTETLDNEKLFVFLNQDAVPLKNWIAQHPTYTFWDDVNNAETVFKENGEKDVEANTAKMQAALEAYLQRDFNPANPMDVAILAALVKRDYTGGYDEEGNPCPNGVDDFDRLGGDVFRVNENGGTISIWMYENKGGLIFRKQVMAEPFIANDEFYFVIKNEGLLVNNGDGTQRLETDTLLTGEYKAYPQTIWNEEEGTWGFYDKNGEFRPATDNDAWLVNFVDGELVSVKKINSDEPALPYFTLIHEEGIALYVPEGKYTIVEVGSKSGGSYQAEVKYLDGSGHDITQAEDDDEKRVILPEQDENGELWLSGNSTSYYPVDDPNRPQGVAQVPVTVTFNLGEHEVIQTLTFYNKTTSLAVKLQLDKSVYEKLPDNPTVNQQREWDQKFKENNIFTVTLRLAAGQTPIAEETVTRATALYYFNMNIYSETASGELVGRAAKLYFDKIDSEDPRYPADVGEDANIWIGTFYLEPDETAAIVMQALLGEVNYWVDELSHDDAGLTAVYDGNRSGRAEPGGKKETTVTNWYGEMPEVKYGYIKITVKGAAPNTSFLFTVSGDGTKLMVAVIVSANGEGSVLISVPVDVTYTIEEISGWSWRYGGNLSSTTATVTAAHYRDYPCEVTYKANANDKPWLGSENNKNQNLG